VRLAAALQRWTASMLCLHMLCTKDEMSGVMRLLKEATCR